MNIPRRRSWNGNPPARSRTARRARRPGRAPGASTTSRGGQPATQPSSRPERRHVHERVVVEEPVSSAVAERGGDRVHRPTALPVTGAGSGVTPSWTAWYQTVPVRPRPSGPRRRPTTHLARRTGSAARPGSRGSGSHAERGGDRLDQHDRRALVDRGRHGVEVVEDDLGESGRVRSEQVAVGGVTRGEGQSRWPW